MQTGQLISIIFLVILLVSGCSSQTSSQESTNKEEVMEDKNTEKEDNGEKVETEPDKVEGKREEEVKKPVELEPLYEVNDANWSVKPIHEGPDEQVILLTIDDAPDQYSLEMATTLKKNNIKAIFFVNGHFIQSDEKKKLLKEIYDLGFPIGNHTMTHSNLKELSEEQQYEEIVELNNQIVKITGERPKFFRAPFGSNTEYSRKVVADEGMLLMNWTYGYDWEKDYMNKEGLVDIMVNTPFLTNGANILMHDREWTNAALDGIINGLMEKGYKMVDPDMIKTLETN
ncbi:MAG: polysaccharide deacetylase family protein [Bacillota bacterium]